MPTITQDTLAWLFRGTDWKNKFIIGSLLALAMYVPVLGLAAHLILYGYSMIVMRAVMRGESPTLPKWENFGELFVDGLKATLSSVAYFIPGVIVFVAAYAVMVVSVFLIVPLSPGTRSSAQSIVPFIIANFTFLILFGIAYAIWMIGMIPTPVAVGQYLRTGEISAGYRLPVVFGILRKNAGGYLVAWVMYFAITLGLGMIVSFLYMTVILCLFMPLVMAPIVFYSQLMWAYLFGLAYREGTLRAGIASPPQLT